MGPLLLVVAAVALFLGHRAFVNLVYGAGDFTGRIQEIDMR